MNIGAWIIAMFGNSMELLIFFSLFAAGMVFTLFGLIFGGDAEHGDFDGDLQADVGADHGDFDGDHDADGDGHGPGLLSIRGVSFLLTGFGGFAFVVMYFTEKVFVSSLAGLAGGTPFAVVCLFMYKVFLKQQASSMIQVSDYNGARGTVKISIPEEGIGEVDLSVAGRIVTRSAVTIGNVSLKSGTPVRVVDYLGDRVTVEKLDK